ncbi:CBS domain-containing protein [Orenia marismortui]|uniref:CBS domain protein n=1 Tax=Orenia marismortui TaxID=46469 RepID=A0A4R8GXN1_9FIRM|nr:CBS domain-containing protein [Orenia marismortui]TDX50948.1 CBS domain protein [Orenia marismortui]
MIAKEIMTKEVITVTPEQTVKEVAKVLTDNKISGVPVLEDGEVVGIVSEGDLIVRDKKLNFPNYVYFLDSVFYLESFEKFEKDFKKMVGVKVKDIMTTDLITVSPDTSVEDIATILTEDEVNRVPVLQDDKLIGIVSRGDIVRYISEGILD